MAAAAATAPLAPQGVAQLADGGGEVGGAGRAEADGRERLLDGGGGGGGDVAAGDGGEAGG